MTSAPSILFYCSGTGARALMAEAILTELGGERFSVRSTGLRPRAGLDLRACALLTRLGHDVPALRYARLDTLAAVRAPIADLLVAFGEEARDARGFAPLAARATTWPIPEPARPGTSDLETAIAYAETYRALRHRIGAIAMLPDAALRQALRPDPAPARLDRAA